MFFKTSILTKTNKPITTFHYSSNKKNEGLKSNIRLKTTWHLKIFLLRTLRPEKSIFMSFHKLLLRTILLQREILRI